MGWIIAIVVIVEILLVIGLLRVMSSRTPDDLYQTIISEGEFVTFKGKPGEDDWVIYRDNNQLKTGIKKGNIIKEQSVI